MKALIPLMIAACLAACGGGDTSGDSTMNPASATGTANTSAAANAPTATTAGMTDFTTFTEKLMSDQSNTEQPLAVAPANFYFPDNNNESAFAAVMPAGG